MISKDTQFTAVQELNQQGLVLYSKDKYLESLQYFQKALGEDPYYIETYINMAQVYIMQDEYESAKESLGKALLIDKNNAVVFFHLGNVDLLQGHTDEAREHYAKAISLGYDNTQIYINLASDAEDRMDLESAISYYNRAIALDKYHAFAKARKAQILIRLKRLPEALKVCDSLIETNPDVFEGYHYKFSILAELGKMDEAAAVVERGIQLFPDDEAFFYDKARLLQATGHPEEALKLVEEKVSINEDNQSALIAFKCELLFALDRADEAEPILDEEFERSHDGEIAYLLNSVAIATQKYDKVLKCCDYILEHNEIDNYYYAALYYRAIALKKLGRNDEASAAFEKGLSFFRAACAKAPGQLQLYFYRAMCHEELEEFDKALELTDYIINVDDSIAEAFFLRSKCYTALGNTTEAQKAMDRAVSINPDILKMMGV